MVRLLDFTQCQRVARELVYYIGRPPTLSVDVASDTLPIVGRHMTDILVDTGSILDRYVGGHAL